MSSGKQVITRFAPSPTGFLHIGGARTALFNWLFARAQNGKFLLRIEDTDRERSTDAAVAAIFEGLNWLGLSADEEPVFQSTRAGRHVEVAEQLLEAGLAYRCYCTPEELAAMRETARAEGRPIRYDGTWRDRDPADAPAGAKPVIRFKAPQNGETIIRDHVQGDVRIGNEQLDDLILLRSDGTPTYMLSVVVDDHDMGITHVIRGDDHLTNAARQIQIYAALGWDIPEFAHIPMIHGPDGAKLSKRHGALGVEAYREMGYLPEAMRNYLARLGWSHGDDEIFSTEQAIEWFSLDSVGKSPARFDFKKLESLNGHYIRNADDDYLTSQVLWVMRELRGLEVPAEVAAKIGAAMPSMKERAKTLLELADLADFLVAKRPLEIVPKAAKSLTDDSRALLGQFVPELERVEEWSLERLEDTVRAFADKSEIKLGAIAQPLRAALTGTPVSPGIFDVMFALGKEESLARIRDQVNVS